VTRLNGHTPWGALRGGKYSVFEAGTRVPFIVSWPETIKPAVSPALVSQIDLLVSFSKMLNVTAGAIPKDGENIIDALLGKSNEGREYLVEQGFTDNLAIISGNWKYIEPKDGPKMNTLVNIELGYDLQPQLYDLSNDIGEKNNLAKKYPKKVKEMHEKLKAIRNGN
jgi:arylsulfatase A-like enzyme